MPLASNDQLNSPRALHRSLQATVVAAFALAASAAGAVVAEGFETPELADKAVLYRPTGSTWTFTGATGAGLQRNGSGFKAPAAPQGMQTAFLKSNDGAATRSVTLAPGTYRVSFWAARRESSWVKNPVQVWLNGAAIGAPIAPNTATFVHYTTNASVTVPAHGTYTLKLQTTLAGEFTTLIDGVTIDLVNPFDSLYGSTFQLPTLAPDDPNISVTKPAEKAKSLNAPSYIDPVYSTRVYRATAPSDHPGVAYVRHEYSRRQAFNANNTRYLAQSTDGNWKLYDASTFAVLKTLPGLVGDCEPIWHPTNPALIRYTQQNGGLAWNEQNVDTQQVREIGNFAGRLPWAGVARVWMKGEGTSSADGRYFAFMAESEGFATLGLFTWDSQTNQIVGTLDASTFNGSRPDHISISASGKYAVPSWTDETLGTRAYPLNFIGQPRQLLNDSQHSDLAVGPDGQDYLVFTDYRSAYNQIRAIDLSNGHSFDLLTLRPRPGSQYAAHISGQAFDKPGWVVVSTYADYGNYNTYPDPVIEPMNRKLMLIELKPDGKRLSVAHTRVGAGWTFGPNVESNQVKYFGEHHATVSRDGSRIMFATNFNDLGAPSSYVVGLPSWAYTPTAGGGASTGPGTPPGTPMPPMLSLTTVTRNGYNGAVTLTSNVPAQCRIASQPSQPYAALYDDMTATPDGLTHNRNLGFGSPGPQTVYAVCISNATQLQSEITVSFP